VGLTLKVRPQINENGTVKMVIFQETSSVKVGTELASNGPTTTKRSIETGEGVVLDTIGAVIGQPRGGLSDDVYRRYLRARISANSSHGTVPHILRVLRLILLDHPEALIEVRQLGTAALEVRIKQMSVDTVLAEILVDFLRITVAAGVRGVMISQPDTTRPFRTATCAFATGLSPMGLSTFEVSTDGTSAPSTSRDLIGRFPPTGTLRINAGTTRDETVTYTSRAVNPGTDGQVLTFALAAPLAENHEVSAACALVPATPYGFGASADVGQPALVPYPPPIGTGGLMADARA
jgi:hypothetical protein